VSNFLHLSETLLKVFLNIILQLPCEYMKVDTIYIEMTAIWYNNSYIYNEERSIPMAEITNEMILQAIKELAEQLKNHSEETN